MAVGVFLRQPVPIAEDQHWYLYIGVLWGRAWPGGLRTIAVQRRLFYHLINPFMLFEWTQVLPAAISDLTPLHREICGYLLTLAGKKRPSYSHAHRTWGLSKVAFDAELDSIATTLRRALERRGIRQFADLDI